MRVNSLFFLLHETLSSLWRHRLMTLLTVSTAAICFTLMGGFLTAFCTLQSITRNFSSELGVMAFMDTRATRAQAENARARIAELPGVASVKLVTREAAWARMKKDYTQLPLDGIARNPLGDELHILMHDVDHIAPVAKAAAGVQGVDEVSVMRDVVRKVQATEAFVRRLGTAATILLLLATAAVISNVIRLTVMNRSREIRIMQLVGATNAFIRLPFLLEGLLFGAAGAAVGALAVIYGGQSLIRLGQSALPFLPLDQSALPVRSLVIALLCVGGATGLIGSAASMHKFLRS